MAIMDDKGGFRSITQVLLNRVILVGVVLTFVVGGIHAFRAYQNERGGEMKTLEAIQTLFVPMLGQAIAADNPDEYERQIRALATLPGVRTVSLQLTDDRSLLVHNGISRASDTTHAFAIPHVETPEITLAELQLRLERRYLLLQLIQSGLTGALLFALSTLLVVWVGYSTVSRHIRRPLTAIADYSKALSPWRVNPPLIIKRPNHPWRDEVDVIVERFNVLRLDIDDFLREREKITAELANERDQLDARVRERTEEIRRINVYLEMLSRFSMLMIELEPDEQRAGMENAMAELSEKFGAGACGVAWSSGGRDWRWRFVWRTPYNPEVFKTTGALALVPNEPGWYFDNNQLMEHTVLCAFTTDAEAYVLAFYRPERQPHELLERRLLQMTAEVMFKLIERWQHLHELEKSRRELFRLSRTDHLTGLANRRYFDEAKLIEGRRAQRTRSPVSVLMIDVDFFKNYNDLYGHGAGDECLVQLAGIFSHHCRRAGELPARMGGEEFSILLPEHDAISAAETAERIRCAVFDLAIPHGSSGLGQVSISCGCATWVGDGVMKTLDVVFDVLIAEADRRLYLAKSRGRNQVVSDANVDVGRKTGVESGPEADPELN